MKVLFTISLLVLGCIAQAQSLDAIESYGVYIEGEGGPVKLRPYRERYFELTDLKEIPHVERSDKSVTLYVYQPDFDPDLMALEARYIELVGGTDELTVDVAPTEREDLYRLSTVDPVPDNRVLFFSSGWLEYNRLAVTLAEPQGQLEALLSDMTQPAHAALPTVKELIEQYPDNKTFKALLPKWKRVERQAAAERDYEYVQSAWDDYQGTEKLALQLRYLRQLRSELNGYLQKHPQAHNLDEARQRLEHAEKMIPELDKKL